MFMRFILKLSKGIIAQERWTMNQNQRRAHCNCFIRWVLQSSAVILFDLSMISGFAEWTYLVREWDAYGSVLFVFVVFCFAFCCCFSSRFC